MSHLKRHSSSRLSLHRLVGECGTGREKTLAILQAAGIEPDADRRYDAEEAKAAILRAKDQTLATGKAAAAGTRSNGFEDLAAAKARSEEARARKLELQAKQLEETLLPRAATEAAFTELGASLRNAFLGLGAKVIPQIIGRDAPTGAAVIDREIEDILRVFTDREKFIADILS